MLFFIGIFDHWSHDISLTSQMSIGDNVFGLAMLIYHKSIDTCSIYHVVSSPIEFIRISCRVQLSKFVDKSRFFTGPLCRFIINSTPPLLFDALRNWPFAQNYMNSIAVGKVLIQCNGKNFIQICGEVSSNLFVFFISTLHGLFGFFEFMIGEIPRVWY